MKARDNPFGAERIEAIRYRPLATSFAELLARLDEMHYRAAIVGPEGAGKTTLLENIQEALDRQGRRTRLVFVNDTVRLDGAARRELLSGLARDEIVLLDGADAIGPLAWRSLKCRLLKSAAGLIITSHRPGRLPTLIDCATSQTLLQEIVDDLLGQGHLTRPGGLDRLYVCHRGNIRSCLRELYDVFSQDLDSGASGPYHNASEAL